MTQDFKIKLLLGLFVSLLVAMNLLGSKITQLAGVSVSVAIFMVPLTFLITDIVEEVRGRKLATQFVLIGTISLVILFGFVALSVHLPSHERYSYGTEYRTIFGSSLRIIVASITGFFLSQIHDVWAFEFWKKQTRGRLLWLRNNLSTMVSQAIDTLVFMMIAFYQVTPMFTFGFIISLAVPYYLFKIAFAVLDTPFVYLGVKWLRRDSHLTEKQISDKT
jgi:hypothetical protein